MGQRITILLVVFLLMLSGKIFAQQKPDSISILRIHIFKSNLEKTTLLSPDFYSKNLGAICKQELILQKKTNIPFRFRLGSLEYVNRMEGKKQ